MSLNIEEREALVRFRIEKSYRTLEEAKGNVTLKFWPAAANRLYYAAYYAVSALLVANGDAAQTHVGVKGVFGMKFIKSGVVSRKIGELYSELFSRRMTGDYDDTYDLQEEDVLPLVEPTEQLIKTISDLAVDILANNNKQTL